MRVEDLRYFEHLSKVLNFTRASRDLHISQPTLSLAIKRLEDEWGVQLLERNRSTVELTEIGHDIMECVSSALYDLDRAKTLARESFGTENSVINVGTIHAMQGKFWSQALFDFRSQSSFDPTITVTQAYSRELLRRLRAGQIDVAICSRIGDMKGLQYSLCWSQSLVLGVNKDHPLARRKNISLNELKGCELLSYNPNSPVTEGIRTLVDSYDLKVSYAFDDEIILSSIVSADPTRIALFCYSFLINAFDDVVCVPIREAPVDFHKTYVVSRDEARRPRVVQEFIEFLTSYHFPLLLDYGQ